MFGRRTIHLLSLLAPVILMACSGQKATTEDSTSGDAGTKVYCFKDSCQHLNLSVSVEVPLGDDSASVQIRDSIIADFIMATSAPGYSEDGESQIKPFQGDQKDVQAVVDYYGKAAYDLLLSMAKSDYESRLSYIDEDTTMTQEDKERIRNDIPMWAFDLKIGKTTDAPDFVVYYSQTYCYYGGAHGGIIGTGAMTFAKPSGNKIQNFLNPEATAALQPLIRKGLLQYYSYVGDTITDKELSERLQIQGTIIPQPQQTPFPNAAGDSLTFTYGQYEIACYADGMPSFTLSVKELAPYLSSEAKVLLNQQ